MASRESHAEYSRHKVLDHIDQHLDQPFELSTPAEVAHFSPFHFHRLFSSWMGRRLAIIYGAAGWRWRPCASWLSRERRF